jgi:TRAP-type uncharacterized transport system fused permease subunit
MQGTMLHIVAAVVTGVVGIAMLASAVQGYLLGANARWYQRVMMGIGALALIKPGPVSDLVGIGLLAVVVATRYLFAADVVEAQTAPSAPANE